MTISEAAVEQHRALEELFFEHQRALLDHDFQEAIARLEAYTDRLREHMRAEEEEALPLYEGRIAEKLRGGATKFFYLEHEKMLRFLEHFREQLPVLSVLPEPQRAILKLLDQEATYKHLVEHHDEREQQFLYPALDGLANEGERARLLGLLATRDCAAA